MPTEVEPRYVLPKDDDPHYTVIGRVASNWAHLETMIDGCIAKLAMCGEQEMACVTAQLIGPSKRMDALLSLFVHRGGSSTLRKKIKAFQGRVQQLGEDRNRIVHDAMVIRIDTGEAHKALITAKGELKYEFLPLSIESMKKTAAKIREHTQEFLALKGEIDDEMNRILQSQLKHTLEAHPEQNPPDEIP
jgi:hypothetical protein